VDIVLAPAPLTGPRPWVFLAGSIDRSAAPWRAQIATSLAAIDGTLIDPSRLDWDATWSESADDPRFREQTQWELAALERADIVAFYFDPTTRAATTLLELGLVARSGRALVTCPEGYCRKGNVDIISARYDVERADGLSGLASALAARISKARAAPSNEGRTIE